MRTPLSGPTPAGPLPPLPSCRHFINLTNGIEALPTLHALGLHSYSYVRIQSTACEQGRLEALLNGLDAHLLMSLALGHCCLVWDLGSRNKDVAVPRALWYGLEFVRYTLYRLWLGRRPTVHLRGRVVSADFDARLDSMPDAMLNRLRYYKRWVLARSDGSRPKGLDAALAPAEVLPGLELAQAEPQQQASGRELLRPELRLHGVYRATSNEEVPGLCERILGEAGEYASAPAAFPLAGEATGWGATGLLGRTLDVPGPSTGLQAGGVLPPALELGDGGRAASRFGEGGQAALDGSDGLDGAGCAEVGGAPHSAQSQEGSSEQLLWAHGFHVHLRGPDPAEWDAWQRPRRAERRRGRSAGGTVATPRSGTPG